MGVSREGNANLRNLLTTAGYVLCRPALNQAAPAVIIVCDDLNEREKTLLAGMRMSVVAGGGHNFILMDEMTFVKEMSSYDPDFDDHASRLYGLP